MFCLFCKNYTTPQKSKHCQNGHWRPDTMRIWALWTMHCQKNLYNAKLDLETRDHQDLSSVLIAALYKANIQRKCIVLKHNNVIMVLYGLYTSNDKLAMMMILIMIMMKLMILMTTMIFTASMICTMCIIDCIDYDYIDDINDIKSTMPTLLIMTMIFMTRLLWQQLGYWW